MKKLLILGNRMEELSIEKCFDGLFILENGWHKIKDLDENSLGEIFRKLGFKNQIVQKCIENQIDGKCLYQLIGKDIDFFCYIWQV